MDQINQKASVTTNVRFSGHEKNSMATPRPHQRGPAAAKGKGLWSEDEGQRANRRFQNVAYEAPPTWRWRSWPVGRQFCPAEFRALAFADFVFVILQNSLQRCFMTTETREHFQVIVVLTQIQVYLIFQRETFFKMATSTH